MKRKTSGFTLVELLVGTAIFCIIAVMVVGVGVCFYFACR